MSELTQQCKAHHHLTYHTLHPLPTCVISDTSQVNKCQTMPQHISSQQMPDHAPSQVQLTLRVKLQRVTKFVTHKCSYEAKIGESEKLLWVKARTPLPWATSSDSNDLNMTFTNKDEIMEQVHIWHYNYTDCDDLCLMIATTMWSDFIFVQSMSLVCTLFLTKSLQVKYVQKPFF